MATSLPSDKVKTSTNDEVGVTIVHGVNQRSIDAAGMTVGQIRKQFGDQLNVPDGAVAVVGGEEVSDGFTLGSNAQLQFVKQSGTNG